MRFIKDISKYILFLPICSDVRSYSVCNIFTEINPENMKEKNSLGASTKEAPYYFEDGFRRVYPFYHIHSNFCKRRWLNKSIFDVYRDEFGRYTEEECKERIKKGLIKINNKIVCPNYVLENHDFITAHCHRHELPVLDCPIEILFENDDFLVVNKPPSIPVHPCGLYYYNSMLQILCNEYPKMNLHVTYRLDRLTSGVLVFTKSSEKSKELHHELAMRNVSKEYICRVEGDFPEGTIICNKPIKNFYFKIGLNLVHSKGKVAVTEFKKLNYNGKSSVVLCKPHTGRTHQIRVHLQYLGHPVINDPVYNSFVFGSVKGKNGMIEKSISELLEQLLEDHSSEWGFEKLHTDRDISPVKSYLNYTLFKEYYTNKGLHKYNKDNSKITYDEDCYFCKKHNPEQCTLGMFLHARKYAIKNWSFESPMPFWAAENWNVA